MGEGNAESKIEFEKKIFDKILLCLYNKGRYMI